MYLKQIELENFKSFGSKVTIPLLRGYTAVTGPNGSGKSNISDAILFVLGPKSSKAIRAGKLTDLIFNGGKTKKPASYTKVSLVFENTDRLIPLDYDIVKLTRLVKLSSTGEGYNSYFYVNGNKSTLGEFDTLLANARISADGYNLVQQGDVTRIVEMGNLDRRRILDDISGISRYDEDITRAEGERSEAEGNIDRITIILEELEKQLVQLEEEKENAIRYLELKDRLEAARAQHAHKMKESTETEIASIREQISQYERAVEELKATKERLSADIVSIDQEIRDLEREISEKGGDEFARLKERMDAVRIEMARAKDRAERASDEIDEISDAMGSRREEVDSLAHQVQEGEAKVQGLKDTLSGKEAKLEGRKEEFEALKGEVKDCDNELAEVQGRITDLDTRVKDSEEIQHTLSLEKDRLEERREALSMSVAELEEGAKNIEFEISDADWNIKEFKVADKGKELRTLQEKLFEKKRQEIDLTRQSEELEQSVHRLTREYNQLRAEAEAAENVARGYNRAVGAILEARDRGEIHGIHGTIAELADVDERYEVALNVAAGGRMQAIVVDDDQVAAMAINHLKKNRLGRATFLPLNKMLEGRPRAKAIMAERQAVGYAIDLIRFDPRYRSAFWHVLGDTVVVESLDQGRRLMGGVRIVTQDGELLEASGAMVGGTVERSKLKFGSASKGRMEEIAEKLRAAIQSSEDVGIRLKQARAELREIEDHIRTINSETGAQEVKLKALEARRKELVTKLDLAREDLDRRRGELLEVNSRGDEISGRLRAVQGDLVRVREEREDARRRLLEMAPTELSQRLKELQNDMFDLSNEVYELRSKRETAEAQLAISRERLEDLLSMAREAEERILRLRTEADEAGKLEEGLKVELAGLKRIEDSMGKEIVELRDRRDSKFKDRTRLEGEREKVQVRIETSRDFSIGLQTKLTVAQERLEECLKELEAFPVAVELPLPSLESIKATIKRCENALAEMGAVNLRAIEDYDEKRQRYDGLKAEIEHLNAQREELLALMAELNEKKKVAFMKVYEAVNENFVRVYAELSGGGEASLKLEDEKEPFQGGLLIRAKPKNGKLLRLEALSGGEKSLTALAFIFAIQEYQPSPFYLLDEVDMFLDSVNAEMVARRVAKGSGAAQFVQISLRKVTLGKAEHIIGVSRQPNGVSKVIMQPDLNEVERYEEELERSRKLAEGTS